MRVAFPTFKNTWLFAPPPLLLFADIFLLFCTCVRVDPSFFCRESMCSKNCCSSTTCKTKNLP